MNLETRLTLLRILESNPDLSQRAIAHKLGISLGKTNYCLRALIEKGWVKAANFRKSPNKGRYFYQLTPTGLVAKAALTQRFLKRKLEEHEALIREIEELRREVGEEAEVGGT